MKPQERKVLELLGSLSREIRCCSRDEAFCGGVTFHQFRILDAVAGAKEIHLSDLHDTLSVEKSTTTRLVSPLIRKGYLKRAVAEHDSRAAKLVLTKKGKITHRKVLDCILEFSSRVLENIPHSRRETVLSAVEVFTSAIRKTINASCCK